MILSRRNRRRGGAAVEFAIVAPFVFFVIFTMIDYGRYFMIQHLLTEAARRGCQEAVRCQKTRVTALGYSSGNTYVTTTVIDPFRQLNNFPTTNAPTYKIDDTTTSDVSAAKGATANGSNGYGQKVTVEVSVAWKDVSWINWNLAAIMTTGNDPVGRYTVRKE